MTALKSTCAAALLFTTCAFTPSSVLPTASEPIYIAHAGGRINKTYRSNSLEALDASYAAGFRYIELDFSWTRDRRLVLIHDWNESLTYLFGKTTVPTESEFLQSQMRGGLSPLSLAQLESWAKRHPDALIISDIKLNNLSALSLIKREFPVLAKQIIPQIYKFEEYAAARRMGYPKVILTVYRLDASKEKIEGFTGKAGLFAVTLPWNRAAAKQRRSSRGPLAATVPFSISSPAVAEEMEIDGLSRGLPTEIDWTKGCSELARRLDRAGVRVFVHTVNDHEVVARFLKCGIDGVYTDIDLFKP